MILNYKEYGSDRLSAVGPFLAVEPSSTVFFLHGLLGSADNWGSTSRELAEAGLRCIAVDQRNHGSSPHSPRMNYPLMAEDLIRLADSLGIEQFSIVGHSMGGKTAMETALSFPDRVISLVVADIAPVRYNPAYSEYINSLKLIDLSGVTKRSEAGAKLEQYIPDRNLRMFFLTNLRKGDDGILRWRINIDGITDNYENIWRAIEGGRSYPGPVLFLKGSDSDFIQEKYYGLMKELFPTYSLSTIEGSGHWVHTEQPAAFRQMLKEFLSSKSS
ncbi:MAG TPA: alpha/beta hydrolase [Spirochaeta sp.]|nr:alpha/beta hydrolase [Spirochaeta sp.]